MSEGSITEAYLSLTALTHQPDPSHQQERAVEDLQEQVSDLLEQVHDLQAQVKRLEQKVYAPIVLCSTLNENQS